MSDLIDWFNATRLSVMIAALALLGVFYSWRSARSAQESAAAACSQAASAREQIDLGRQQIDLLLRQVAQTEEAQRATQQAHEESLQPMVVVDIVSAPNDRSVMSLVIENIGPSVARNVRIVASPPPTRSVDGPDEKPMHEWHIFTHGIKTMPPGHRMEFFFDVGFQRFKPGMPTEFTFTVDAEGPFGPAPQMTYEVNLNALRESWIGQTTVGKVVDQLESMTKELDKLTHAVQQLDPETAEIRRRSRDTALKELNA